MRLSCPSPLPTEVGTGVFACGAVRPLVPLLPPLLLEVLPPPDEPQAATSTAADAAASSVPARVHVFMSQSPRYGLRACQPGSRYGCRRSGFRARRRSRSAPGLRAL